MVHQPIWGRDGSGRLVFALGSVENRKERLLGLAFWDVGDLPPNVSALAMFNTYSAAFSFW
jgi:hypothetical protein